MKSFTNSAKYIILVFSSVMFFGCSSIEKANIPATANAADEATKLETDIQNGYINHYDLLASEDLRRSEKYLKSAKENIGRNSKQDDVYDDLRYARAYFDRAQSRSESRKQAVDGILAARQDALNAGARNFSGTRKEMGELDDEMRSASDDFSKKLSPHEFSKIQQAYTAQELAAIQFTNLNRAHSLVTTAKSRRGKRYAPQAYDRAQKSISTAENAIAADRHNPDNYKEAVKAANRDAAFLVEVVNATKQGDERLDEATATKMVMANQKIKRLDTELSNVQDAMGEQNTAINEKEEELRRVTRKAQMQTALETARSEFTPEEAEAFQQGDRLLIRLKAMKFSSNRAELPPTSLALLAKVRTITAGLSPQEITVSGHTDSVGSAAINQTLSQARAEAVAKYLKTSGLESVSILAKGYGFSQPLATNKTKLGRAQNRRVDIEVVPSGASNDVEMRRALEPNRSRNF